MVKSFPKIESAYMNFSVNIYIILLQYYHCNCSILYKYSIQFVCPINFCDKWTSSIFLRNLQKTHNSHEKEDLSENTQKDPSENILEDHNENMQCAYLGYPCVIIIVQCAVSAVTFIIQGPSVYIYIYIYI